MAPDKRLTTIRANGTYKGLPVIPETTRGLTAMVVGANGISGAYMIRVLCENPDRWTKIYALSLRDSFQETPPHVEHISIDLLQDPEDIAAQMKARKVKADYVFFFAYIQPKPQPSGSIWSATEELNRVNSDLLDNFLWGMTVASITPKRILVQLGAKYYGLHLGPAAVPQEETDIRLVDEPNFYYDQEDTLEAFCQAHGCGWNTTRPSFILGAVPDNAMSLCYPLLVYATVQKHLGQPLVFPGDLACWENLTVLSSSTLNAHLSEWVVLTDAAANKSFNATDDSPFTWGKFWPKYAAYFHMPCEGPDTSDAAEFRELVLPNSPPPRGWGPPGKMRFKFTLTEWAKRPEVANAWREIATRDGLRNKELGDVDKIFGLADAALLGSWPLSYSNTRLRKMGFFGFVDSTESIFRAFKDFSALNMAPKVS